jgi:MOSC domain-containing protein YiiM
LFDDLARNGRRISPGDLGENITTSGLQLERLPPGALLRLGSSAAVELTGLRTPCVLLDRFQAGLKKQLIGGSEGPLYKCGVVGIVREGGPLRPGDKICVFLPESDHARLPPL